ncbi:MAG: hypothetical protein WBE26_07040 [Phycisphaerae bacterium]
MVLPFPTGVTRPRSDAREDEAFGLETDEEEGTVYEEGITE